MNNSVINLPPVYSFYLEIMDNHCMPGSYHTELSSFNLIKFNFTRLNEVILIKSKPYPNAYNLHPHK